MCVLYHTVLRYTTIHYTNTLQLFLLQTMADRVRLLRETRHPGQQHGAPTIRPEPLRFPGSPPWPGLCDSRFSSLGMPGLFLWGHRPRLLGMGEAHEAKRNGPRFKVQPSQSRSRRVGPPTRARCSPTNNAPFAVLKNRYSDLGEPVILLVAALLAVKESNAPQTAVF